MIYVQLKLSIILSLHSQKIKVDKVFDKFNVCTKEIFLKKQ